MPAESGIHAGTPSMVVQAAVVLVQWIGVRHWFAPFGAASGRLRVGRSASGAIRTNHQVDHSSHIEQMALHGSE
jgi:hypothetical protein